MGDTTLEFDLKNLLREHLEGSDYGARTGTMGFSIHSPHTKIIGDEKAVTSDGLPLRMVTLKYHSPVMLKPNEAIYGFFVLNNAGEVLAFRSADVRSNTVEIGSIQHCRSLESPRIESGLHPEAIGRGIAAGITLKTIKTIMTHRPNKVLIRTLDRFDYPDDSETKFLELKREEGRLRGFLHLPNPESAQAILRKHAFVARKR